MNRNICIHGHFYQPHRENPWLETIEYQESAQPYHDWNQRITSECYASNLNSRILGSDGKIIDVVNNYQTINFDFGPTLLSWLKKNEPKVYRKIVEADKYSFFIDHHGQDIHRPAIALCYNHIIMPLANSKQKHTQVVWGIRDFEYHFGRSPEGMWLPETAVDLETLEILATLGIKFTILSPHQAKRIRKLGTSSWTDVLGERIDPKQPYLCILPSGAEIVIFFFDGPISREISFNKLLNNGEALAKRLLSNFSSSDKGTQFVTVATDGEVYGHHHQFGEMALSFCLNYLKKNNLAKVTGFGKYLADNPPVYEVEIVENTSWSCKHGIDRWRADCGCRTGGPPGWSQSWRTELRNAMDWLNDTVTPLFEQELGKYINSLQASVDDYIDVILDRSPNNVEYYLLKHATTKLTKDDKVKILSLLELQRHAMLMYTSCGWYFDELSGIETIQVLQHACRVMYLARKIFSKDLEPEFFKFLVKAKSNKEEYKNGLRIYDKLVKPARLELEDVVAHFAISSLFKEYSDCSDIHCYRVIREKFEKLDNGNQTLVLGQVSILSVLTWEEKMFIFAFIDPGNLDVFGGINELTGEREFEPEQIWGNIKKSFIDGNITKLNQDLGNYFTKRDYSVRSLFKDELKEYLGQILNRIISTIDIDLYKFFEKYAKIIRVMEEMAITIPQNIIDCLKMKLNNELIKVFNNEQFNGEKFKLIINEINDRSILLDNKILRFSIDRRMDSLFDELFDRPDDLKLLENINTIYSGMLKINFKIELMKAQNIYFKLKKEYLPDLKVRAENRDKNALDIITSYSTLGKYFD